MADLSVIDAIFKVRKLCHAVFIHHTCQNRSNVPILNHRVNLFENGIYLMGFFLAFAQITFDLPNLIGQTRIYRKHHPVRISICPLTGNTVHRHDNLSSRLEISINIISGIPKHGDADTSLLLAVGDSMQYKYHQDHDEKYYRCPSSHHASRHLLCSCLLSEAAVCTFV